MTDTLLVIAVVLAAVGVLIQVLLLLRLGRLDLGPVQQTLQALERSVRDELGRNREEFNGSARESREELANAMKGMGDSLNQQISNLTHTIDQRFDRLREAVEQRLQSMQIESAQKLGRVQQNSVANAQALREEIRSTLKDFNSLLVTSIGEIGNLQKTQLELFSQRLDTVTKNTDQQLTTIRETVERRLAGMQEDAARRLDQTRLELGAAAQTTRAEIILTLKSFGESSAKQLDQMRATVDEKLQSTLEKRLGESFKQVSDRLEQVHKGLGEMQALALGVGDLKKMLTNVKSRGTWGEVQLGAMLEQILSPDQYAANVSTKGDGERVEFAVKLPGRGENRDEIVWLPIDAKFPIEDYQRLVEAEEKADPDAAEEAAKRLEFRIKQSAADICAKYIAPPKTTDFGILFLPTEGLFAEAIRRTGLAEFVQRECRVVIAGPTTLWSILNSLQMGFRTLAIEKRSSEVWTVLGAVKTEFGKFGDLLDGVKKKLDQASNNIDDAARKSRTIARKLRDVQELPAAEAQAALANSVSDGEEPDLGSSRDGLLAPDAEQ